MFGLDRSPVVGFVQIAVFLVGLAISAWAAISPLTPLGRSRKRQLLRISASVWLAPDMWWQWPPVWQMFRLWQPSIPAMPYFGHWQAIGVMIGEVIIAIGFLLMIPYSKLKVEILWKDKEAGLHTGRLLIF